MEFKGNLGKKFITEDNAVIIKQKSFFWGTFTKKIPYSKIKFIEVSKSGLKSGYIRIVEDGDDRVFDEKKSATLAANDDNSILISNEKEYELASAFKEFVEEKKKSAIDGETVEIIGERKKGKFLYVFIAIIAFVIIQCNVINSQKNTETKNNNKTPIYERFGMTENEFTTVNEIFEKCGFTQITKVEKEDELDNGTVSYYVEMKGVEPNKIISAGKTEGNIIYVYLTKDNKVSEISVNFNSVYKNGKVLNKVVAFTKLTVEEQVNCIYICENSVKKLLKSPTTAKFCKDYDYRWSKEKGIIKAQGFVDSQNGFGAMVRTNYILTYDCVNKKAISMNIDGETYKYE